MAVPPCMEGILCSGIPLPWVAYFTPEYPILQRLHVHRIAQPQKFKPV